MTETARLYDVRYSRYSGDREPRWRGVLALARSSALRALGLRRTTGSKVWPFLLVGVAHLPAISVVGVPLLFDAAPDPLDLLSYSQLLTIITPVIIAFAATTLPSLLTRERRDRVLSLYFSTALSPREYLLGKALAALGLMLLVTLSPMLVVLIGSILTADAPLNALQADGTDAPAVLLAGFLVAGYYAVLGLAAGALTAKRLFAVGGLLAVLLVTPVLSGLVYGLTDRSGALAADLASAPIRAAATVLPGPLPELDAPEATGLVWGVCAAVVLLGSAVLVVRYTRGDDA